MEAWDKKLTILGYKKLLLPKQLLLPKLERYKKFSTRHAFNAYEVFVEFLIDPTYSYISMIGSFSENGCPGDKTAAFLYGTDKKNDIITAVKAIADPSMAPALAGCHDAERLMERLLH
jgi:hypothetical protein